MVAYAGPIGQIPLPFCPPTNTHIPLLLLPSPTSTPLPHLFYFALSTTKNTYTPLLPLQLAPTGLLADLCWVLLLIINPPLSFKQDCLFFDQEKEMSASLSKSFGLSLSLKEEVMVSSKKQGIVSILDCERTKSPSLRRTLSADTSSMKWLSQHGSVSPLKKIASSDQFQVSNTIIPDSFSEDEYDQESHKDNELDQENQGQSQFDIWNSIQEEKKKKLELEKRGTFDIWSSILLQKPPEEIKNLPSYVHPLVKRSASSLSQKSLEICTESLGSETGSDGFSSYPPSESGDAEEEKEEEQQQVMAQKYDVEDGRVAKYNLAAATKKTPPRSFPPPLPSLSRRDGVAVQMRSHRDNGRLVLESVSVPSQNTFHAHRQDGRLVLTFANKEKERSKSEEEVNEVEQFEVELERSDDVEKELEEDEEEEEAEEEEDGGGGSEEVRFVMEQAPKGVINVHRLAIMMNKSRVLANGNPTWSNKFNEIVKFEEEELAEEELQLVDPITPLTQSLPPRPPAARMIPTPPTTTVSTRTKAAASFNAYEYYWKPKPMAATTTASVLDPITQKASNNNKLILSKNLTADETQKMVVLRGNKGDYLLPLLKSCKEPRRSLLFWEPYCIATS